VRRWARTVGLSAHVCTGEDEAMAWLDTSIAMYH